MPDKYMQIARYSRLSLIHILFVLVLCCLCFPHNIFAIGQQQYVTSAAEPGSFPIVHANSTVSIYVDSQDCPGVIRAAGDLQSDINRVTSHKPSILHETDSLSDNVIIIGTVGKSRIIDSLAAAGKIDVSRIAGKWESFSLQVVPAAAKNRRCARHRRQRQARHDLRHLRPVRADGRLSPVLVGGCPRTTKIRAVRESRDIRAGPAIGKIPRHLSERRVPGSERLGVREVRHGPREDQSSDPSDVANYNSQFYARIFEAILRMKGNYLWPAMWNNAFNEDDPNNARLADEYGIVMGTSHQEPMLRAQKEWDRRYQKTLGSWNYYKNPDVLQDFWREGIRRNKNFESILTIGLRGANDTPMIPGGTVAQSMALLEEIVAVQRKMIAEEINPDVSKVPQLWCLYKEVQEYYNAGLRVPDDVTLLWADDNWGNVRRLPTEAERKRAGGAGIYYHFDYVGGPRNYKWINTVSIPTVWEQMSLAKEYGADRIWIVNVGHFKHVLLPMEFFLHLGWNTGRWTSRNIGEYTRLWAAREFGPKYAAAIAEIVDAYTKYNARRKPELLEPNTYSLTDYQEAEKVVADFRAIEARAEEVFGKAAAERQRCVL